MSSRTGKDFTVKLGSTQIVGIGSVSIPGVTTDLLDQTQFGDEWRQFKLGLKDGGELTFSGFYDPDDSTGQDQLRTYNENSTEVTSLRIYIDDNSYWTPATTNPASYVLITGWSISADMDSLAQAEFTAKVSGKMVLV